MALVFTCLMSDEVLCAQNVTILIILGVNKSHLGSSKQCQTQTTCISRFSPDPGMPLGFLSAEWIRNDVSLVSYSLYAHMHTKFHLCMSHKNV